jgi:hypothetical protein
VIAIQQRNNDVIGQGLPFSRITKVCHSAPGHSKPEGNGLPWRCGNCSLLLLVQLPECLALNYSVEGVCNSLDQGVARVATDVYEAVVRFVIANRAPGVKEMALKLLNDLRRRGQVRRLAELRQQFLFLGHVFRFLAF